MTATDHAIATKDDPAAGVRSASSRLGYAKLECVSGIKLITWQDGVADCLASLIIAAPAGPK